VALGDSVLAIVNKDSGELYTWGVGQGQLGHGSRDEGRVNKNFIT
jgi:hypothetical protein